MTVVGLMLCASMTAFLNPAQAAPTSKLPAGGSTSQLHQAVPADCTPTWNVVSSPNPSTNNNLHAVIPISSSDVWAVGYYDDAYGARYTLVEHWNGTSWSIVTSPSPGTQRNELFAVTAISPSDVWAVGYYESGDVYYTLVEHLNGTSWSVVPSPNPGSYYNALSSVTAISPSDIWAVGEETNGTSEYSLVEHWNGTSWNVVSSPKPGSGYNVLSAVTAISPSDIWAVGYYYNGGSHTLVEHWNGTSWNIVPSFDYGGISGLSAVTAISSNDVWAVGNSNGTTLVEHWDGTSWNLVSSPSPGSYYNALSAVTAISPSDVWAVGSSANSNSSFSTLVEHWNGTSWSIVSSPSPGSIYNGLGGITAISPSDVWAVGQYANDSTTSNTLVEHYSASGCPTNTPGGPTDTPVPTDTPLPTVCPNLFVDINGNIFFHAINYLYCNGVVNGTDPTHYSPAGTSTRAQFAKVVVLGFGESLYTPSSHQDFTDVPPGYFAYVYIETGFHAGILSGFDANGCTAHGATYPCYLPNIPITRGQLTKLVVGAAHYPLYTPTGGNPTFSDVPANNIFFAFIETAHNKGVINGYPDGTFRPNNNIRRDEMAQIVYKGVTTP